MDGNEAHTQISAALTQYMIETLEAKQETFGGLPPCPFVRAERIANKIEIILSNFSDIEEMEKIIRRFSERSRDQTLLIVDPQSKPTLDQSLNVGVELCERLKNIRMIAICVHPEDRFSIGHLHTRDTIPVPTMLVQSAEAITKAKTALKKTNYYINWSDADFESNLEQFARFL